MAPASDTSMLLDSLLKLTLYLLGGTFYVYIRILCMLLTLRQELTADHYLMMII